MGKRNYVEEILSIRLRNELNPRWGGALIRLEALEHDFERVPDFPSELVRYFPVAIVATMEAYFRSAIKELIDFGPPFSDNAARFDNAKPDLKTVLSVQGKVVTVGDLIGHLLPFKSVEDIDCNITTIIGQSFLERLKTTQDRWAIEVEGAAPKPIIENSSEVYRDVKETFRLRHVYCHEITRLDRSEFDVIKRCFVNSSLFIKAADQLIWDLVAPNAPLTQSAMNVRASEDLRKAEEQLNEFYSNIVLYLDNDEKEEFRASQQTWAAFRELEANSYANRWGKGGTIWPMLNSRRAEQLTLLRVEELKRELERVQKNRPLG
jgi:uncharacterized protein YecT (DUF1311 family)